METYNHYIDQVIGGTYPAGKLIVQAVERHLSDLEKQETDQFPYVVDYSKAERHIKFAELCRHWKGEKAGQRIVLEPHQHFLWAMLYGWRHAVTGRLRFHRYMKLVARKNYKTTEAALVALDHLLIDRPAGAQVYAGATKTEQAMIVVNDAGKIAQRTPELTEKFELFS